jgi:bacteriocin-like protein
MSDDKKENPTQSTKDNAKPTPELSAEELKKISGGVPIKGDVTEDKHKDWIELNS